MQQHAHELAVAAHKLRVRQATTQTVVAAVLLTPGWLWSILSRNKAIAGEMFAIEFAPFAFGLLLTTVLVVGVLLGRWRRIYQNRPVELRFAPLPDSEAPRHGAFDGTTTPPTRW